MCRTYVEKINIDNYWIALGALGLDDVGFLGDALADHGIDGDVDVYRGDECGDGEILFRYQRRDGRSGALRFAEDGVLLSAGNNEVLTEISQRSAQFVIAGIFGEEELSEEMGWYDAMLYSGLELAIGCYSMDRGASCTFEGIDVMRADVARMRGNAEPKKIREHVMDITERANRVWRKGRDLIDLATEEEDIFPWGIDSDVLRQIYYDSLEAKLKVQPTDFGEAMEYARYSEAMLRGMLSTYSGYATVRDRSAGINCRYIRKKIPAHCGRDEEDISGFDISVVCGDVGVVAKVFYEPQCYRKRFMRNDYPHSSGYHGNYGGMPGSSYMSGPDFWMMK